MVQNKTGVKQGDVCSPVLYSVFINDVAMELQRQGLMPVSVRLPNLPALLYADDQMLLAVSNVRRDANRKARQKLDQMLRVNLSWPS